MALQAAHDTTHPERNSLIVRNEPFCELESVRRERNRQDYISRREIEAQTNEDRWNVSAGELEEMLDHTQRVKPFTKKRVYPKFAGTALYHVTGRDFDTWPILRSGDILEVWTDGCFRVRPGSIILVLEPSAGGGKNIVPKVVVQTGDPEDPDLWIRFQNQLVSADEFWIVGLVVAIHNFSGSYHSVVSSPEGICVFPSHQRLVLDQRTGAL